MDLITIISPAAKLHLATLVVEGKPGNVDLAGTLEDARWHVQARAVVAHHHVRRICAVEAFVRATQKTNIFKLLQSLYRSTIVVSASAVLR